MCVAPPERLESPPRKESLQWKRDERDQLGFGRAVSQFPRFVTFHIFLQKLKLSS